MSIATEITRINTAKSDIRSAIISKGVDVPADAHIDTFAAKINDIKQGDDWGIPLEKYLCFTAVEATNISIAKIGGGSIIEGLQRNINGGGWSDWDDSVVALSVGDKMYVRADKWEWGNTSTLAYSYFSMSGQNVNASGDIQSLNRFSDTVDTYGYRNMFNGCTSLVDASALQLSATTLAVGCYYNMFTGCSSLVNAPKLLPATTLAQRCYYFMFYGCTSLVNAPELPATTLADECYSHMFSGCTSLENAPTLAATTLAGDCYNQMFRQCIKISQAIVLAEDISATSCVTNMFSGCTNLKTLFTADGTNAAWVASDAAIPAGCNIYNYSTIDVDEFERNEYLYFIATSTSNIAIGKVGTPDAKTFYYSFDKITWTPYTAQASGSEEYISLSAGQIIYWKGDGAFCNKDESNYYRFRSTSGSISCGGNVMSLLGDGWQTMDTIPTNYCFCALFYNNAQLRLVKCALPATTLTQGCYMRMFWSCSNTLSFNFVLPAKTLTQTSYRDMLRSTGIMYLPTIKAQNVAATQSMYQMFGTTKWLNHVDLSNILTGEISSTEQMRLLFNGATGIESVILPNIKTLQGAMYYQAFQNCTALKYIKCLATNISAYNCVNQMCSGVAPEGTFVCAKGMTSAWRNSNAEIPAGWVFVEVDE